MWACRSKHMSGRKRRQLPPLMCKDYLHNLPLQDPRVEENWVEGSSQFHILHSLLFSHCAGYTPPFVPFTSPVNPGWTLTSRWLLLKHFGLTLFKSTQDPSFTSWLTIKQLFYPFSVLHKSSFLLLPTGSQHFITQGKQLNKRSTEVSHVRRSGSHGDTFSAFVWRIFFFTLPDDSIELLALYAFFKLH